MRKRINGVALFAFVIGLVILFVGIALMYMLPEYIIGALNNTGAFNNGACYAYNTTPAQCGDAATNCCEYLTIHNAYSQVTQLRSLGFVVVVIAIIWMIISIVAG